MNEAIFFFALICGPLIVAVAVAGFVWARRRASFDRAGTLLILGRILAAGAACGAALLLLTFAGLPVMGLLNALLLVAPFLLGAALGVAATGRGGYNL